MTYGMEQNSVCAERTAQVFRFETKSQLKLLRQIFGDFSTLGCRRKRPKLNCPEKVQYNNKLSMMLGNEDEEKPFCNRNYRTCIGIGKDEFGAYVQVVYDSYLYTREGLINFRDKDVSEDVYTIKMMTLLLQSNKIGDNEESKIGLGCMIRRDNGSELLKIIDMNKLKVTLEYILPKSRLGEVVVENDMIKINNGINALLQ